MPNDNPACNLVHSRRSYTLSYKRVGWTVLGVLGLGRVLQRDGLRVRRHRGDVPERVRTCPMSLCTSV
jgi:hypothetical protein